MHLSILVRIACVLKGGVDCMKDYNCTPQGITFKIAAGVVIINRHSLDWGHHGGVSGCLLIKEHASGACLSRRRRGDLSAGICVAEQQRSISSYMTRTCGCGSTGLNPAVPCRNYERAREQSRKHAGEKERDVSDDDDHRAREGV